MVLKNNYVNEHFKYEETNREFKCCLKVWHELFSLYTKLFATVSSSLLFLSERFDPYVIFAFFEDMLHPAVSGKLLIRFWNFYNSLSVKTLRWESREHEILILRRVNCEIWCFYEVKKNKIQYTLELGQNTCHLKLLDKKKKK